MKAALLCPCLLVGALCLGASPPLKLVDAIPLPGVKGRFDHFACDASGQHIFVAALGNGTLEIIDAAAAKHLHSITGLSKPTGVAYLAASNRLFVADGADNSLRAYDAGNFTLLQRLGSMDDADNVRCDPVANRIYVGYGDGALGLTDSKAARVDASIRLPAHPESFQLERDGKRIFVNVPDAKQIVVIDRDLRATVARWPMEKFRANFPMALDERGHRLFVGCRQPPRLVVLDTATGEPVANVEISGDTDDLFYDERRNRVYLSCGEGFLDVIQCRDDRFERLAREPTRAGARTCFYSPELDRLFLAVPQRDGHDAELRIYQPD